MTYLLAAVRGLEKTSPEFRLELCRMAERLKLSASAVAAVMSFETGQTFDPAKRNPLSSATGIIQFMEATARKLGTTTAELAQMTAVEQLRYVEAYYRPMAPRIRTTADHYMAVFAPSGIGQGDGFALYRAPSAAYTANKPLDRSGDGTITVGEAAAPVLGILAAAKTRPPYVIEEPGPGPSSTTAAAAAGSGLLALLVGGAAWLISRWKR